MPDSPLARARLPGKAWSPTVAVDLGFEAALAQAELLRRAGRPRGRQVDGPQLVAVFAVVGPEEDDGCRPWRISSDSRPPVRAQRRRAARCLPGCRPKPTARCRRSPSSAAKRHPAVAERRKFRRRLPKAQNRARPYHQLAGAGRGAVGAPQLDAANRPCSAREIHQVAGRREVGDLARRRGRCRFRRRSRR